MSEETCECPPGAWHQPGCELAHWPDRPTAEDRERLKATVDKTRREQIAQAHGRELHQPAWDDEKAWAEIEGTRP